MTDYLWQRPNWTHFQWDNEKIILSLGQCRLLQGKLLGKIANLGLPLEIHAHMEILVEEIIKTAAIEGENLDMEAVRSSVARNLGIPEAGLRKNHYIDGLVTVLLDATNNHENHLNAERLFGWQATLFPTGYSGLRKIIVGQWRGDKPMQVVSGPVGREKIHFEAPPAESVPGEMERFFQWWQQDRNGCEGLLRAAIAHFWFVTIHPFEDGNGRIARALTDMAAAQDDRQSYRYYSLSSQIMAEREPYYNVLENCQKGRGDITQWLTWFLDCFCRAIERSEKLLAKVLDKAAFWKTHQQAHISDRQKKVINRLLDAGKGAFEGGLTTRKYISITGVSRATAFREMDQLVKSGLLLPNPGRGRNASYDLNWNI